MRSPRLIGAGLQTSEIASSTGTKGVDRGTAKRADVWENDSTGIRLPKALLTALARFIRSADPSRSIPIMHA
jgi:hypothetical protein